MTTPYHVRLALSQYGDQFRAELFTEDLGDTDGDLLSELPPSLGEWIPFLAQGAELPPDAARKLGKDLFAALLGQPETGKKWTEVLAQAERQKRPVRLLIDATSEAVRDLPYGLMCEPHDDYFLFRPSSKQSVGLVRILRRCSPRTLKLRDRLKVLIAAAEPKSADVPAFDAPLRLKRFWTELRDKIDLFVCGPDGPVPMTDAPSFAPYCSTTRAMLKASLLGDFDVVHLLAHGHGAGVLLCTATGAPAETTAGELGEWCGAGKTSLAFLQVCKAGQTADRGGFGGVAQQLLNPKSGNLAAVIASTFPLDAENSTDSAIGFYQQLVAGKPPEEALTWERPEADWCWAFLELWARPGALGGSGQRAAFQFVSPYRGLSSFNEQDADLFFGRRTELAEVLQILRSEPVIAVVGDSGSGKTSLLQAGLIHGVRREGMAGKDRWKIASLRPGYRPAQALLQSLGTTGEPTAANLAAALKVTGDPLLVVFDQFEEIFTLARDAAEVQLLTAALADAVTDQPDRFRLVLGMRSEFLGQAASVRGLSRLIRRPWVLRPPGSDDLREIVAGPAEHCGYTFQGPLADGDPNHATGLLDRILADPLLARDQAGATSAPLPLLQFALERLWLRAVDKGLTEFTHAEFDEVGGMAKAIALHAEAVFQSVSTATGLGATARLLCEHLITALVSAKGTRQPRSRDALLAETANPESARAVVDYLVGERLLTVRSDPEDLAIPLLDLAHEALIRHWDRLRGWLSEDPQGRAMREEYRKATEQWAEGMAGIPPKSRRGLPGFDMANTFRVWLDNAKPKLGPLQTEFAEAIRVMLKRQRRIRRSVMTSLAGLTLAAMVLAVFADIQAGRARTSAEAAKSSEGQAKQSEAEAKVNATKAKIEAAALVLDTGNQLCESGRLRFGLLAFCYALQLCPDGAADDSADDTAKTAASEAAKLRRVILTNLAGWAANVTCLDAVMAFPGARSVATDCEGRFQLMQNADSTVRLYEIETGHPVGAAFLPLSYKERSVMAAILPNAKAVVYGPSLARVWDLKAGEPLGKEFVHGSQGPAELSPDAKHVATGSINGELKIWDAKTGKAVGPSRPHSGKIHALNFSPDGTHIVTGCGRRPESKEDEAGVVHFFALDKHEPLWRHVVETPATAVAVSADGKVVAGGGYDVHLWNRDTGKEIGRGENAESTARSAFDPKHPDELMLCNPSGSLAILNCREYNPDNQTERVSAQGWVSGAGFRSDGRVFTANVDGTVRIWTRPKHNSELPTFRPTKGNGVLCVDFRPDGHAVALGTRDGFVYHYPLKEGAEPIEFTASAEAGTLKNARTQIVDVKFSEDGRRIIAQDIHLHKFLFEPKHAKAPRSIDFDCFALADDGRTALQQHAKQYTYFLRDLDSGKAVGEPFTIPGLVWPSIPTAEVDDEFLMRVKPADISRDRSRVALIDRDGRVHLVDPATGKQIGKPLEHIDDDCGSDAIRAVSFCPKSKHLLTRSYRARAVWSAATGALVNLQFNHIGVQVSRFSPSGNLVLAGTNFNAGQVWDLSGKLMLPKPLLHGSQLWGISANRDETAIVSASYDRSARLWDTATGKQLGPPMLHALGVSDAAFSPDGTKVLTGSWDGTARLWAVPKPLPDDVPRITAWVETLTGLKLPAKGGAVNGVPTIMKAEEWKARKAELEKLGGAFPVGK